MTRRALLAALAAPALPVSPIDCVRTDPCAGDVIAGPNGATVEVVKAYPDHVSWVKIHSDGKQRIWKQCPIDVWRNMPDWHLASVVRLGVRG